MLGDFLASAVNPNVGAWTLSPAATEIEAQTVRWIAELIGFPRRRRPARQRRQHGEHRLLHRGARGRGAVGHPRARASRRTRGASWCVYASAETHTWIQKAADLCGLGTNAIRWIDTDDALRMDVAALRRAIDADRAAGRLPFLVVGTAGSVSTGAVDPLPEIAAVCREKRHLVPRRWRLRRLRRGGARRAGRARAGWPRPTRSRSIRTSGCTRRSKPAARSCATRTRCARAFAYHPPYYHFDERAMNFVDYGPQNSRGFRALKVWLALRQVGARRLPADDRRRHPRCRERWPASSTRHPELELMTQALSITTFRYVPADLRPQRGDDAVEQYLERAQSQRCSTRCSAAARSSCRTRSSAAATCCAPAS